MFQEPNPDEGPVLITVKYVIDPAKAHDFLHYMYRYERIRRRDGATEWGVFADTESPAVYLETFLVDSWAEHERQHERFTELVWSPQPGDTDRFRLQAHPAVT